MRIFRFIRDALVCLAYICVLLLTAEAFYLQAKVADAVSQFQQQTAPADPGPVTTGCPFGPDLCGG